MKTTGCPHLGLSTKHGEYIDAAVKVSECPWCKSEALEADRDQISLTLDVAKADRDKWFNRARVLEAALRTLWQNQDHDTWVPDFVAEVRALLKDPTPETGDDYPPTQAAVIRDNGDPR